MLTFDNNPVVYWALCYFIALVVVFSSASGKVSDTLFVFFSLGLLTLARLPVIRFNRELNPDESQMISHALTLREDPVYWRSVDGTTIGPLDNYVLVIPDLLGLQINYSTARLVGLACLFIAFLSFFDTVRIWFGAAAARTAGLFPLLLLSFTRDPDFLHFSSEQLPVALLAVALWLLARLSRQRIHPVRGLFWFGFTAGLLPFAKLQSVPQALVLVAACVVMIWTSGGPVRQRLVRSAALGAGGLAFPLLVLLWTVVFGVAKDLVDFYILGNLEYAGDGQGSPAGAVLKFADLLRRSPDFAFYFLFACMAVMAGLAAGRKREQQSSRLITFTLVVYLLTGIYAATQTGHLFAHYLNFCIYPVALLVARFGGAGIGTKPAGRFYPVILLGWLAMTEAYFFLENRQLNRYPSVGSTTLHQSETAKKIKEYSRPGDRMAVWGWQCAYYVEAQLAQGTAENHTERCIYPHPLRETYRARYLADMERNLPVFFIDAVGKNSLWLQDSLTQSHRSFGELAGFIAAHYDLVDVPDGNLLYVRKDRAARRAAP